MSLLRSILSLLIAVTAITSAALFATTPPPQHEPAVLAVEPVAQPPTSEVVTEVAPQPASAEATVVQTVAETPAAPKATEQSAETPPAPEPEPGLSDAELNAQARGALVNIFCLAKSGNTQKPLSGSGVVIDPRGVVLTNAHIAQYLLLAESNRVTPITCTVRTGSPAKNAYEAALLYVSPEWVEANALQINSSRAKGTGKNDFALLMLSNRMDGSPVGTVAHLPYSKKAPTLGQRMLLAAYPAGFLSSEAINESLYPTSAFVSTTKLYTFDDPKNTDLFSVGGSVVSQAGASGGAAIAADGTLAGIIATALLDGDTSERDLRAITVAHIERSLAAAGKGSLAAFLSGSLRVIADDFADDIAPGLIKQLEDGLRD